MVSLRLVRLLLQQFIIQFLLIFLDRFNLHNSFSLSFLHLTVLLFKSEQLFKTGCEIAIFLEIDLGEFLKTIKSKELCNLFESFLPNGQKFIQYSFDLFDKVYLGVFAIIQSFYFSVQQIVFFLFGFEQGLNSLYVFGCSGACERF